MKRYEYKCPECGAMDLVFAEYVYTETTVRGLTVEDEGTETESFGDSDHDYSDVKPVDKPYLCRQCCIGFKKKELVLVPVEDEGGQRAEPGERARGSEDNA